MSAAHLDVCVCGHRRWGHAVEAGECNEECYCEAFDMAATQ